MINRAAGLQNRWTGSTHDHSSNIAANSFLGSWSKGDLLRGIILLSTLLVPIGLPQNVAAAQEAEESSKTGDEPKPFSGAFYGPEAHVGYGWSRSRGDSVGSATLGFRHAFVFLLGDSRLSYSFDAAVDADGPERHGFWFHTCIHPAAAVILGSDWLAYTLSSPFFELGVGGLTYVDAVPEMTTPALGWSLGGGLDIPLGNPDRGSSPWLHLLYRHRVDATNSNVPSAQPRADVVFIGVGWRLNGTLF